MLSFLRLVVIAGTSPPSLALSRAHPYVYLRERSLSPALLSLITAVAAPYQMHTHHFVILHSLIPEPSSVCKISVFSATWIRMGLSDNTCICLPFSCDRAWPRYKDSYDFFLLSSWQCAAAQCTSKTFYSLKKDMFSRDDVTVRTNPNHTFVRLSRNGNGLLEFLLRRKILEVLSNFHYNRKRWGACNT